MNRIIDATMALALGWLHLNVCVSIGIFLARLTFGGAQ